MQIAVFLTMFLLTLLAGLLMTDFVGPASLLLPVFFAGSSTATLSLAYGISARPPPPPGRP